MSDTDSDLPECNRCGSVCYDCRHVPKTGCLECEDKKIIYNWLEACIFCVLYDGFVVAPDPWPSTYMCKNLDDLVWVGYNHGYNNVECEEKFNCTPTFLAELYEIGFEYGTDMRIKKNNDMYFFNMVFSPWMISDLISLVLKYGIATQ